MHILKVLAVSFLLVACAQVPKNHFGEGVDPVWATRVYELCQQQHPRNNRVYNQCLEDYAEYD